MMSLIHGITFSALPQSLDKEKVEIQDFFENNEIEKTESCCFT